MQVSDYSIDCTTSKHSIYVVISYILIVLFAIGVPIALIYVLVRSRRDQQVEINTSQMDFVCRKVMAELHVNKLADVQDVIIDLRQGQNFGSLINAYRPGLFLVEPLDMLRKLSMIGFLTWVDRGATLQVYAGVFLSFIFFALHVKYKPFRHEEDNVLRATTEAHLFIVIALETNTIIIRF